ncbi:MAG: beta-ketoacyl synthase N-terminal-like domain-containing protein, partial [Exilibacterium sp.]
MNTGDDSHPPAEALTWLVTEVAEVTQIPRDRIDVEADLEELGLDSVMIAVLNKRVEKQLKKRDPTLFYQYRSLKSMAGHLSEKYSELMKNSAPNSGVVDGRKTGANIEKHKTMGLSNSDIAIIGLSGRYPQAENLEEFWENLRHKQDCIVEIPQERFDYRRYFSEKKGQANSIYCKWGGFIKDVENFDAGFFNLSRKDVLFMDPQERLFLETAWQCLEESGLIHPNWQKQARDVGVFAGASFNNYQLLMAEAMAGAESYSANSQTFSIANRVSYFFNFTGPSVTLDTACSSSL